MLSKNFGDGRSFSAALRRKQKVKRLSNLNDYPMQVWCLIAEHSYRLRRSCEEWTKVTEPDQIFSLVLSFGLAGRVNEDNQTKQHHPV